MDKNLEKLSNIAKEEKTKEKETVNHPAHYNRENTIECIEEMELIFGTEAVMNFCLLNVWKYRYRADSKNGDEDISKSDWYLAKYKELKNEKQWKTATSVTLTPTYEIKTVPCDTKTEIICAEYINNNE